jgi:peroxiredoxin
MQKQLLITIFSAIVLGTATSCRAAEIPAAKIKVGDTMPDFTLPDPGGQMHSLYDLRGHKAVAVIFIATRCPYSNAFTGVMSRLAQEYSAKGVAFVGINANKTEPAAEVAEHARTHGLNFLILKDPEDTVANRLGARVTPEVFLMDSNWVVRYHGALGGSQHPTTDPHQASDEEVRPALDAVLTGQPVAVSETKAFGCTIKR